ncbi:MAG: divergent polysaccharide deacetylase family protein [Pseudomonadota bacterium]
MLIIHFVFDRTPSYAPEPPAGDVAVSSIERPATGFYTSFQYSGPAKEQYGPFPLSTEDQEAIAAAYAVPEVIEPAAKPSPAKIAPEYAPVKVQGSPKIAIIIDDMGVDRKRSFKTIDIDAPLTLAFLPYATDLDGITQKALEAGHELMIHMPMQATTNPVSLGPIALKTGMSEDDVKANMQAAFESFDGYVGVNNHMGSKVTQDEQIMDWAMETLKGKNLYFIDSKTIGSSVAAKMSRANGLPTAVRDVFLDHENTAEFVMGALRKLERVAVKNGYAIAIGHPKDVTINGLKQWLPDAQARGFEIVHASKLVGRPKTASVVSKPVKVAAKNIVPPKTSPKVIKAAIAAQTQPAAGELQDAQDPNSAEARAEILRKLLGQAP